MIERIVLHEPHHIISLEFRILTEDGVILGPFASGLKAVFGGIYRRIRADKGISVAPFHGAIIY